MSTSKHGKDREESLQCRVERMRVRVGGTVSRSWGSSRRLLRAGLSIVSPHQLHYQGTTGPPCTLPFVRLLPFICIFIIVASLGILAVSEMSLMGKRVAPSVVGGGGAASRIMPGRLRHYSSSTQPKSPSQNGGVAFKIEPLLRRNAVSIELSAQATVNKLRAAITRRYITMEQNWSQPPGCGTTSRTETTASCQPPPADCPRVPPSLVGVLNVSSWLEGGGRRGGVEELERVRPGGWWTPVGCTSRHLVALVIPYRDRPSQLDTLMRYLHPLLQRHQINYRIFVVEQAGNDTFNKGVLMNAGFLTGLRYPVGGGGLFYHCFVFHDVDMLPEDDRNLYTCPQQPRHMSVAVNELNYKLPYRQLVGGVFAIKSEHFFRVNGYSNLYWGWGGEDDDMGYRVEHVLSSISRPPEWIARYTMLRHEKRRPLAWKVRVKLLRTSWRRYRLDGLNTVQYQVLAVEEGPLYTRILVDVGTPPHNIRLIQREQDARQAATPTSPEKL